MCGYMIIRGAWILLAVMLGTVSVFSQSRVFDTKHNLTAGGNNVIKAATENNTCVFCHTPHTPRQSSQLWNHKLSTATYELYSSDYLTSLNYTTPNQPNSRSKLCLSCHDGTVAIGAVYNNLGSTNIVMTNGVTTMPSNSPGNLGTSLINDHPVGYIYDNTKDPELIARAWPWNTPVKLDPDASNGTVECQTCHDPHNNTNGKFLRIANNDAALCTFCHSKTGWISAVHKTSTQNISKPDSSVTTLGEWSCRNCHQSHGGAGVPYLLISTEENNCYGSGCHGINQTGINTKNIQGEMSKLYRHPTDDVSNEISGVLQGVRGVSPTFATEWTQPTTFTAVNPVLEENQICFKCHSYYAFGNAFNGVTNIVGPSSAYLTDQAMEFNPQNHSAHPVVVSSIAQTGSPAPKSLDVGAMTVAWNSVGNQTMYCSDCHGNDQPASSTAPQGPHGSNAKFMLTGTGKYWPTDRFDSLWSLDDIRYNRRNWQNDLFCANCHTMFNGLSFLNNAHESQKHKDLNIRCITCHVVIPHGAKRSRLIGYDSDVQPYNYSGPGQFDKLVINGFQKAVASTSYTENSCSMNGVCHGTQLGAYEP
jgi:predicted CXXCH cytochrome family protein